MDEKTEAQKSYYTQIYGASDEAGIISKYIDIDKSMQQCGGKRGVPETGRLLPPFLLIIGATISYLANS